MPRRCGRSGKPAADLSLYVFIHPLPRVIGWSRMDADDLGRMLGWEFSLMTAAVRLINSGLLDELPTLRIQFSHFAGGIGRYIGRIRGFQQRDKWGTAALARHGRRPQSRSIIISISGCTMTSPDGRGPTMRAMGGRLGAVRSAGTCVLAARLRQRLSAGRARGGRGRVLCRGDSRRSAPMAVRSPQASMRKNSFPILAGGLPPAAKPRSRSTHERHAANGGCQSI